MRVTDAIGNTLTPGQKLYWKQADLYVTVLDVKVAADGKVGALSLQLDMGVPLNKDTANFPMFIRVVDPDAEAVVAKAMGAR